MEEKVMWVYYEWGNNLRLEGTVEDVLTDKTINRVVLEMGNTIPERVLYASDIVKEGYDIVINRLSPFFKGQLEKAKKELS